MKNSSSPSHRSLKPKGKFILLVGIWALFGMLASSQFFAAYLLQDRAPDEPPPPSIGTTLLHHLPAWLAWALLTPPIWWLGRVFPIRKEHLRRGLLLHFGFSLALALVHRPFFVAYSWLWEMDTETFWRVLWVYTLFSLHEDILIYWMILGVGIGMQFRERIRERELKAAQLETQLARARLFGLQKQIQPHFFFNTLHAVGALVRTDRKKDAIDMMSGLSDLMRHVLDEEGQQLVALRSELDFIDRYLQIERIRFQERVRVEVDVPRPLQEALVPSLILQPLVENAIRHGVESSSGPVAIRIRAHEDGDRLHLEVHNSGPRRVPPARRGIGLSNVRARLRELYGDDQSFELDCRKSDWTIARIEIPLQLEIGELDPLSDGEQRLANLDRG